jgi:hypothetical protein
VEIAPVTHEIDDRVCDELSWTVPRGLASAIDFENGMRESLRASQTRLIAGAPDGVDGFVLEQKEFLTSDSSQVFADQLVLQVERLRILGAAEPFDFDRLHFDSDRWQVELSCARGIERVKVGDSYRDGVGGVRRRGLSHFEKDPDHEGNLPFVRGAAAHHRLLNAAWSVFMHGQTVPCGCQDRGTAGGTERNRGLVALDVDNALNRHGVRAMLADDFRKLLVKRKQTTGGVQAGPVSNDSIRRASKPLLVSGEHGITGDPKRGVNGDYCLV